MLKIAMRTSRSPDTDVRSANQLWSAVSTAIVMFTKGNASPRDAIFESGARAAYVLFDKATKFEWPTERETERNIREGRREGRREMPTTG